MAYSFVQRDRDSWGTRHAITGTITFSGNYPDEGEPLVAADFGLAQIRDVIVHGLVRAADGETAIPADYDRATGKLVTYEGSAAGTALTEKTAAEAYPTGAFAEVTVIGR